MIKPKYNIGQQVYYWDYENVEKGSLWTRKNDDKLIMRWSGRKLIGQPEYLTEVEVEYI